MQETLVHGSCIFLSITIFYRIARHPEVCIYNMLKLYFCSPYDLSKGRCVSIHNVSGPEWDLPFCWKAYLYKPVQDASHKQKYYKHNALETK